MADSNQKITGSLLRRVISLSDNYKGLFYWTLLLAILQAPLGILRPHLINVMVDNHVMTSKFEGRNMLVGWNMLV